MIVMTNEVGFPIGRVGCGLGRQNVGFGKFCGALF